MIKILADNGTRQTMYSKEEVKQMFNFEPQNTKELNRFNKAYNHYVLQVKAGNSGALGTLAESMKRRVNSSKWHGSKATQEGTPQADFTAKIDGKLTACESKINGGRLDDIKDKYIVYTLNIHNSIADKSITPRIMKTETFMNALYRFNAVKQVRHNGVVDGIAIQPSNRKLWAFLETMPEYDRTKEYSSDEIK